MLTRDNLRGVWVGVTTPWDAAGRFDEEAFAENVSRLCASGVHGIYTTGTTGEFYALNEDEYRRMVKIFADATRGTGVPTQVGCTWTDTRGCIWRAEIAAEHGLDALQTALPFWVRLNDDEVVRFFADLSHACPDMPIIHYNNPNAKRYLDARMYRRIAAEVPALIGTKQVSSDLFVLIDLFLGAPQLAHFVNDWLLLPFMMLGAPGTYSALALFNPRLTVEWYEMCVRGEWAAALEIQKRILSLIVEVDNPVAELGYGGPAGDKAWAQLAGVLTGGREVRPPYASVPDEVLESLRQGILGRMPEIINQQGEQA